MRSSAAIGIVLTAWSLAQAQTPKAVIEGVVINAATHAAVAGAGVRLSTAAELEPQADVEPVFAKTDAAGRFVFKSLTPDLFILLVRSPGSSPIRPMLPFIFMDFRLVPTPTSVNPENAPAVIVEKSKDRDGTLRAKVTIPLSFYATIDGKVTSPDGLPMAGCLMEMFREVKPGSTELERIDETPVPGGSVLTTNDLGEYHAAHLEPGTYYAKEACGPVQSRVWKPGYRETFYREATDIAAAAPIRVSAGEHVQADIRIAGGVVNAPSGTQAIEGVAVNAISGAPLAGVHVDAGTRPPAWTETDGSGHFRLTAPRARSYFLRTGYPGYLRNDKQIRLSGNGDLANLRIELCQSAAIAGRIEDEDGFPVEQARVNVLGYRMSAGQRKPESIKYIRTDDLGRFRFANLRPGRYWIVVSSDLDAWDGRYADEYFPGVYRLEDSTAIDLKPGEEFAADVHLKKQEGVTVSGRSEPPGVLLRLCQEGSEFRSCPVVRWHPDGDFPGTPCDSRQYVLSGYGNDQSRPPRLLLARLPVTVGRENVGGIVLQARQVQTVNLPTLLMSAGRNSELLEVTLRPATDPGIPLNAASLVPGHYDIDVHQRFLQHGPGSEGIRHAVSAQLGGKEVLQTGFDLDETTTGPLVVTLGSQSMEVRGILTDAAGRPVAGELLALISPQGVPDSAATTDADGSFRMTVWRAGEFRWVSITDQEEWNDPDYLLAHAGEFPPLQVAQGQNAEVNLRFKM